MLAKAVGIQAPAIYRHFKSKKEILRLIDEESRRGFQEMVFDPVKSLADPEERIRVYIRNMISYQFIQGNDKSVMISSNEVRKANKNRKYYDRQVFDFFRETLGELSRRQNLAERLNPTIAAFSLFSLVMTAYKWYNPRGIVGLKR